MAILNLFFYLITSLIIIEASIIKEKHNVGLIEPHDGYWVVKIHRLSNRPIFPAYIRFFNARVAEVEHEIECSRSSQVHYHKNEVIFLTKGHLWSPGDSYYITLDEGALYSDDISNSTEHSHPEFWQFKAVIPQRRMHQ